VGKLHQIGKIVIRVYANDHLPPHFHAIAAEFEALIGIESLTIMRGRLPSAESRFGLGRPQPSHDCSGMESYQPALPD
jgi:hypothetical protein